VRAGDAVFTVADVPGLIPGASSGKGLGLEFLRHVERCSVLAHVVDCATEEPGRDPLSDIDVIEAELAAYGGLADRPRVVILNKVDVPGASDLAELVRPELEARGLRVLLASAATTAGLREVGFALADLVTRARAAAPDPEPTRIVLRPTGVGERDFAVHPLPDGGFEVTGDKPVRWVRQTNFANDEAVGYLADRLARLGVEKALVAAGAEAGAEVTIGGVTFDWHPTSEPWFDRPLGPRGSDARMDELS